MGAPEGDHGGGGRALRGSWPGEGAGVHPNGSPELSEGAVVWQRVGKGMGPPSTAAPPGEPATSRPLGLLILFPSTFPLASHSPCAHVFVCLCVCCVCACIGGMCHMGVYMCARISVYLCVCVDVCTYVCCVRHRPVF